MPARTIADPDLGRIVHDYGDPDGEARACRAACAMFDFSFMSRARIVGADAHPVLAALTPRPMHDLAPGRIRYAMRINAEGHLLADLTIWRHADDIFEVMSGRHAEITFLLRRSSPDCVVTDLSGQSAIFALQGPETLSALAALGDVGEIAGLAYFGFCSANLAGHACLVGRLGYTGEPGVEIVVPRTAAPALWRILRRHARPAGFAAADMLRIEAGFVLFANEFRVAVTPAEAGLERFGAFPGPGPAEALRLVCFHMPEVHRPPILWRTLSPLPRPTAPGEVAVTSVCHSAVADGPIGLGFARVTDLEDNTSLHDAAGSFGRLVRAPLPIYDPGKKRPRLLWAGR